MILKTRYAWPEGSEVEEGVEELKELERNTLDTNKICYINGMIFFNQAINNKFYTYYLVLNE